MAPRTTTSKKSPHQQYRDSLGKILLQYLSLVTVLDSACTFKGRLNRELRRKLRAVLPDHCVYVYLDTSRPPWNRVSDAVTVFVFNVELVDKERPGLDKQLRNYRNEIEGVHEGDRVLVMQHVLVIGSTPKRDRRRWYCVGVDYFGRLAYVKVHYLDELDLTRLSAAELASEFGQILLAIQRATRSPENTRRAVAAAYREPHRQRRADMLQALDCVAIIWPEMAVDIWAASAEEEEKMSPAARKKLERENFKFFLDRPGYSALRDKYIANPAKRAGLKEGMEKGKQAAYVGILLEILDHRGIQLSKAMAAKLRKLPMSRQPPAMLALTVKSAAEFIKRAGLSNGHQ